MPDSMRQDIENATAARNAERLKDNDYFKYLLMQGSRLSESEGLEAGLSADDVASFNAALDYAAAKNPRSSLAEDLEQGLKDTGLGVERTGDRTMTVRPK